MISSFTAYVATVLDPQGPGFAFTFTTPFTPQPPHTSTTTTANIYPGILPNTFTTTSGFTYTLNTLPPHHTGTNLAELRLPHPPTSALKRKFEADPPSFRPVAPPRPYKTSRSETYRPDSRFWKQSINALFHVRNFVAGFVRRNVWAKVLLGMGGDTEMVDVAELSFEIADISMGDAEDEVKDVVMGEVGEMGDMLDMMEWEAQGGEMDIDGAEYWDDLNVE